MHYLTTAAWFYVLAFSGMAIGSTIAYAENSLILIVLAMLWFAATFYLAVVLKPLTHRA